MENEVDNQTRLFFVVDSIEENEEIFTTLEEAEAFRVQMPKKDRARLYIAMVKNAYQEEDLREANDGREGWNYEDYSDTFEIIKILKQ